MGRRFDSFFIGDAISLAHDWPEACLMQLEARLMIRHNAISWLQLIDAGGRLY